MLKKFFPFALFAATIPAANWLIENVGAVCVQNGPCLVPVGFGLMAPSGVLMIGLALVLRDWVHETGGLKLSAAAVLLGGALSLLTSAPHLAMASAIAFIIAEFADLAVYAPLRTRNRPLAVFASQIVGAAVDSALFVYVAFGSFQFSAGTALGKIYAGALAAVVLYVLSSRRFEK